MWSSAFLVGVDFGGAGLGGGLSLGVGVVLRVVFHGLIESTALAKYDFSAFFSAFFSPPLSTLSPDPAVPSTPSPGGCGAILSERLGRLEAPELGSPQICLENERWTYTIRKALRARRMGSRGMAKAVVKL